MVYYSFPNQIGTQLARHTILEYYYFGVFIFRTISFQLKKPQNELNEWFQWKRG